MFAGAPPIPVNPGGDAWVAWLMAGLAVAVAIAIYVVAARVKERPEPAVKPEEQAPKAA